VACWIRDPSSERRVFPAVVLLARKEKLKGRP
jgi:hypothetical protein